MKLSGVTKFTEFYNASLPRDINEYLRTYPTDVLILKLSRINAVLFTHPAEGAETQEAILESCFNKLSNNRNAIIQRIRKKMDVAFFTYPCIAQVIRDALLYYQPLPEEDIPFNEGAFEDTVFDRILMQNDLYYNNDGDDLESYEGIWKLQLMQQHYLRSNSNLLLVAPVKNFLLYQFMRAEFANGEKYLEEFYTALGLASYFEYYLIFRGILQQVFDAAGKGEVKHILTLDAKQEKLIGHYALREENITSGKFKGDIHMEIVTRPLYYAEQQHPVVLDFYFFNYITDFALTYKLHELSSLKEDPRFSNFTKFKAHLGKSYYEDFIARRVLSGIFRPKNFKVVSNNNNSPLSDFTIVRNQRDVILIELKSVDLHPATLEDLDVNEFKNFLVEQFCIKKGVPQLVKQISKLANTQKMDRIIKDPANKHKLCIYPVIVYTEHSMDVNGVNQFLNEHLEKGITPLRHKFRKIYPLTAIKLDLFIRYYSLLREDPKVLYTWIQGYHELLRTREKTYRKTPNPWTYFEQNLSFQNYVNSMHGKADFGGSFSQISHDLGFAEE